jgi:hypothetical protein
MTTASDLIDPEALDAAISEEVDRLMNKYRSTPSEASLTALVAVNFSIYAALYVIAQNTAPKTDA